MPSDFIHAQHAAQLAFLQGYLDNRGWATEFMERSAQLPINVLSVAAPVDPNGRERKITFAYVPLDDEDLDYLSLLQFYSPLPIMLNPKYVRELDALLGALNQGLALGHFGHKDNEIFMRHIYTTPQTDMVDEDMFVEAVLLFFSLQTLNSDAIEAVATGKKTAAEALDMLNLSVKTAAGEITGPSILDHVKAYFEAINWPFDTVKDMAITTVFEGTHESYRCFAQSREANRQLICYAVSPLPSPEHKLDDMMKFITLANYGMASGNFELDLSDGEIRYKTSISFGNESVSADLLAPLFLPCVVAMDTYFPAIRAVIEDDVSPEDAVNEIETVEFGGSSS